MNLFSNPIIFCGSVALGIFLILILVVVICCKRSAAKEREELKALSEEIECDFKDEVVSASEEKIENVLSKMQEALDLKEEKSVSFEQEQEEPRGHPLGSSCLKAMFQSTPQQQRLQRMTMPQC